MKIRINVTQKDIDKSPLGRNCTGGNCPIWNAAQRSISKIRKNAKSCWVTLTQLRLFVQKTTGNYDDPIIQVNLPESATRFIMNFDDGRPVKPFSFTLEY